MRILKPWHSSVTLSCDVYGVPLPRLQWLKGEYPIQVTRNTIFKEDGKLQLSNLSRPDSNNYTCTAQNKLGSDSVTYQLIIQGVIQFYNFDFKNCPAMVVSLSWVYFIVIKKINLLTVPPSAPLLYISSSTSNSILFHWKITDNGDSPITSYTIRYKRSQDNQHQISLPRRSTSHELKVNVC